MSDKDEGRKSKFPAPIYRRTVLEQVFKDAKRYFLHPLFRIQYAHTLMLARQGILDLQVAAECLKALNTLDLEEIRNATYDGTFEDLFFYMEGKLAALCGLDNAGKMHMARSRNDIDLTMYRMVLRCCITDTLKAILDLRRELAKLAWTHRSSLMPAYTHNQPAQPFTLGHYLMAVIECLERDTERFRSSYERVNRCPLGACAITTTGFPIDRNYTAELLGFEGLQVNSYGAIASVDYLTESCAVLAVCMLNLGRLMQDLLQWSTVEFDYIRLSDAYVQISSIMPQKRNPVPFEHVRILASRGMMEAQAVLGSLHNTPYSDINDSEDDLQPRIYEAFACAQRGLELAAGALSEAEIRVDRMAACVQKNFLTTTELADTIVRLARISFREAHEVVSKAVKALNGAYDRERMVDTVIQLLAEITGKKISLNSSDLDKALDARHFVEVRSITGGPALVVLEPEIQRAKKQIETDQNWLLQKLDVLEKASRRTQEECEALITSAYTVSGQA